MSKLTFHARDDKDLDVFYDGKLIGKLDLYYQHEAAVSLAKGMMEAERKIGHIPEPESI